MGEPTPFPGTAHEALPAGVSQAARIKGLVCDASSPPCQGSPTQKGLHFAVLILKFFKMFEQRALCFHYALNPVNSLAGPDVPQSESPSSPSRCWRECLSTEPVESHLAGQGSRGEAKVGAGRRHRFNAGTQGNLGGFTQFLPLEMEK